MLYDVNGKKVNIIITDELIEIPDNLKIKILENFESMQQTGANIWNGEVICVSSVHIDKSDVTITCKKSDYAHYLYGEKIGCPSGYECRNLSAGCLLETADGYYVIGELDNTTSYPNMLQTTGGGIDKKDISGNQINVAQTIIREALEEININLNDRDIVLYNKLKYIFVSRENEQPGVQVFSKAKIKMTLEEMEEHFQRYTEYLRANKLEVEFKKLHFLKKENALLELEKLDNPKRGYFKELISADIRRENKQNEESR